MVIAAIQALARDLPRFAEEGADYEVLSEEHLGNRLIGIAGARETAMAIVAMARQSLRLSGCLDERELAAARWRFVSFPAYLFARSLLENLASGHPRVLDAGFWDPSEVRVQPQRDLLRTLEGARLAAPDFARPIRRVWVAWAAISCDGAFLLVRREDRNPLRTGSKGEFVLPGGRTSPVDLPPALAGDHLRFFDPYVRVADLSDVDATLDRTLRRELSEELGLDAGGVSAISPAGGRIAHTALEGANSAHAITEYLIQVFKVRLQSTGKEQLLRRLAERPQDFAWFSPSELLDQKNSEGQTSFLHALVELPAAKRSSILDPESCDLKIGQSTVTVADQLKVDIPISPNQAMTVGKTGRERHFVHDMDEDECALLAFLAAVRRDCPVSELHPAVRCVPHLGWLLIDDPALVQQLRALNVRLTQAPGNSTEWSPLDFEGNAVRLNVAQPEDALFAPEAFSLVTRLGVPGKNFRIRLERSALQSGLGTANFQAAEEVIPFILGTTLEELAHGKVKFAHDNLETWKREQRELRIMEALGIRLLVRVIDKIETLCVRNVRVLPPHNGVENASGPADTEGR